MYRSFTGFGPKFVTEGVRGLHTVGGEYTMEKSYDVPRFAVKVFQPTLLLPELSTDTGLGTLDTMECTVFSEISTLI